MIKAAEALLMRILRVPPEPEPPAGAPGSLRVFRAGRNYMRLKFVGWIGAQLAAVWGILVSITFIREVDYQMSVEAATSQVVAAEPVAPVLEEVRPGVYVTPKSEAAMARDDAVRALSGENGERRGKVQRLIERVVPLPVYQIARKTPPRVFFWIKVAEAIGLLLFVFQFFWSLGSLWLDYTQRWYMVTDRSLRLRWGIVKIQETTMSFANLQQVTVKQGPLQRLLRLADVEVRSAGGGGGSQEQSQADSMHRSVFHAVENAQEIRDLIIARLTRFRQAGLGDPDDHRAAAAEETSPPAPSSVEPGAPTLEAARELLSEVRAWREGLR